MDSPRTRSAFLISLATLAPLAGACDQAVMHLRGRILNADGTPAVGREVGTLDFHYDGRPRAARATTDAEGRYDLSGPYSETLTEATVSVAPLDADFYDALDVTVHVDGEETEVPDVRLWDDQLVLTSSPDGGVRAQWNAPPEGRSVARLVIAQGAPGIPGPYSWWMPISGTSQALAPEILEDGPATITLVAGDADECHRDTCVFLRSRSVAAPGVGRVPASRGLACTLQSPDGTSVALVGAGGAPCPVTDGTSADTRWDWTCDGQPCAEARSVTVDLAVERPLTALVARDVSAGGAGWDLSVASDNTNFAPVGHFDDRLYGGYELVTLPDGTKARYVRITATDGSLSSVAELSAF